MTAGMTVSFISSNVLHGRGASLDFRGGIGLPDIFGATRHWLEKIKFYLN